MSGLKYKISFCTVVMNRLHQLKKTLLQNIKDNKSYENLEIILLDYNSQDGLEDWVKENLMPYIVSGKVVYFKTNEPTKWTPSHSKNLAFKLATGEIVCNIWADYFTGKNFADFVNLSFESDPNIVMTPIDFHRVKNDLHVAPDVLGKVCVKKTDFLNIHGFDERFDRHGFEDYDFVNRLEFSNIKRVLIEEPAFLKFVDHEDAERFISSKQNLEALYISHIDPSKSDCIFLFVDGTFHRGRIVDNVRVNSADYRNSFSPNQFMFQFTIEGGWEIGKWMKKDETIELCVLENGVTEQFSFIKTTSEYISQQSGRIFFRLCSDEKIIDILKFKHFHYTRSIMEENLFGKRKVVNPDGFGKGIVFKNFEQVPIRV